jgi:hypothetical protein
MSLVTGSAGQVGRTNADHDSNYVRRSKQADQNGPFMSPVWVDQVDMSLGNIDVGDRDEGADRVGMVKSTSGRLSLSCGVWPKRRKVLSTWV